MSKHVTRSLLCTILIVALMLTMSLGVFAKLGQEANTATVAGDQVALTFSAGGRTLSFTWDDVNGKGVLGAMTTAPYQSNVDGATTDRTGVLMSRIVAYAEKAWGHTFTATDVITFNSVDNYPAKKTMADAKATNGIMIAPYAALNYEFDKTTGLPASYADATDAQKYANSYVDVYYAGTSSQNTAVYRGVVNAVVTDKDGKALDLGGVAKAPGTTDADVADSIFYIAVEPTDGADLLYYYFTLDELKANYLTKDYDIKYNNHTVDTKVYCNGFFLDELIYSLTDKDGNYLFADGGRDNYHIQYMETDAYHSNYKNYTAEYDDTITTAKETTTPILAYESKFEYTNPDDYNKSDKEYTWADPDYPEYLRIFRSADSANASVIKWTIGIVVSADGKAFNTDNIGSYTITQTSSSNTDLKVAADRSVQGVFKGMKINVPAPTVPNCTLKGTPDYKVITVGEKTPVSFVYDEGTYFSLTAGGKTYNYTMTDLMAMTANQQIPESYDAVKALAETGDALIYTDDNSDAATGALKDGVELPARNLFIDGRTGFDNSYGYTDLTLYRYNGVPLSDILAAEKIEASTVTIDGKTYNAAIINDMFIAYQHTQSKSMPNNTAEKKRLTKPYNSPKIVSIYDGTTYCEALTSITATASQPASAYFTDMKDAYKWAGEAVGFLYEQGIVGGTGSGLYSPAADIKRGDFILMLARTFDFDGDFGNDNFSDVNAKKYYADAIANAKKLGIAAGYNGKFMPEDSLTRQDAVVLIVRTLDALGIALEASGDLTKFSDSGAVSSYAKAALQKAVGAGLIVGNNGQLNPKASLSRAEMAVILYRVIQ